MHKNQFLSDSVKYFDVDFSNVSKEDLVYAYDFLIEKSKEEFSKKLELESPTYDDFFSEGSFEKLMSLSHLVGSMSSLLDNKIFREIDEQYSPQISVLANEFALNTVMYDKLRNFSTSEGFKSLSEIRQKMITKILKNLDDMGISLSPSNKKKLNSLYEKQVKLVTKFQNNITDAQANLKVTANVSILDGMPQKIIDNILGYNTAINFDGLPNKVLLDESSGTLSDVLVYSSDEIIRKKIYNKRKELCLSGKFNNSKLIDKIYKNKQKISTLLGYKTYAHQATEDNMAKNPENAINFINKIGENAKLAAKNEVDFIKSEGCKILGRNVEWWDHEYVCNKILKQFYDIDQNEVKKYFPVDSVVNGLFSLLKKVFDINFVLDSNFNSWDDSVLTYNVYEGENFVGKMFMDLYKRKGKSPGAWLDPVSSYENNSLNKTHPVALLVCNVAKESTGASTMEHNDIVTLFHEMGHALHLLLSKVEEEYFSGFNNVEHDAVEIPSQALENFAYNTKVLELISSHVSDGSKIPLELANKLANSKNFLSATFLINMVKFSEMDLLLYSQDEEHPYKFEEDAMKKWAISDTIDFDRKRMPMFSHIFGGGYAAGYYAYQWADVYAVDTFSYLSDLDLFTSESLERFNSYKKNILYTGGSNPMEDNFNNFKGSQPSIENYLNFYLQNS